MARKKNTSKRRKAAKRQPAKKKTRRKRPAAVTIRRSSGRKEKFDLDRMAKTTGRSGVPFMMARDIAKNVSKKVKAEAREGGKDKTVTAGRVRKMVAEELRDRNRPEIASSYVGEVPENTQKDAATNKSFIGSADKDQHEAHRPDIDSVMHDRSKRHQSA
jgi:hypothetical protein